MGKQDIIKSLNELLEEIGECIENYSSEEIKKWLLSVSLHIWAGNSQFSESYLTLLPVFLNKEYTVAQTLSALQCLIEEKREVKVPLFFQEIVRVDLENDSSKSRDIIVSIGYFLANVAMINGDFTLEEARRLHALSDQLVEYCDQNGVISGKERDFLPEMITPLNESSYLKEASNKEENEVIEVIKNATNTVTNKTETLKPLVKKTEKEEKKDEEEYVATINSNDLLKLLGKKDATDIENNQGVTIKDPLEDSEETFEDVLAELDGLVGLDKVKQDVKSLLNFIKISKLRTERGLKTPTISYHLVFTGNPGTGKTTIARLIAKIYCFMGILPQGHLVETDRSGLVAGYLGQTAIKTQKVIQEALGGVLFIDEAYALANDDKDSYGKEAIETILKAMEDHRDELIVIVAGYDELMHTFIDSNPGLRSRFNKFFHFPDYYGEELYLILKRFCEKSNYALSEEATVYLRKELDKMYENREEHFGNARAMRNLFEHAINHQANRLVEDDHITDEELIELTLDDILVAMEVMNNGKANI